MTSAILNAVLALGVIVMVVAPLVWAIVTQHRDHVQPVVAVKSLPRTREAIERRHERRQSYKPAVGQA